MLRVMVAVENRESLPAAVMEMAQKRCALSDYQIKTGIDPARKKKIKKLHLKNLKPTD